jgi:segregation and condensation protein B
MPYQKLADVTGLTAREVKRLAERISKRYEDDKHGIMFLCFKDTCQFCTKEQYGPYVREALSIRRGGNLSSSSMEVLAIVAYNQPVTRAFIDAVRGVDSNYAVSSLIDKELIASVGRLDAPGRPVLYGTTDKFLRVFGLATLDDLTDSDGLYNFWELLEEARIAVFAPEVKTAIKSPVAKLETAWEDLRI